MLDSLHHALSERAADSELRAIVIRGNGPVFSAGHDLKELVSINGINLQNFKSFRCENLLKTKCKYDETTGKRHGVFQQYEDDPSLNEENSNFFVEIYVL